MREILQFMIRRPCILWESFGVYCPGCGGTRAAKALIQGNILQSLWYHPLVFYAAIGLGWFLLSHAIAHPISVKTCSRYLWIGLVILIGNWVLRNLLLFLCGIPL